MKPFVCDMNVFRLLILGLFCSMTDAAASGNSSIFGSLWETDIEIGTLSILIVIGSVLSVEQTFHYMEHAVHDTPFEDMVHAIEKELMIVGTMAFILKVIIETNSGAIEYEWLHALHFADTLVPVTSFCLCFIGFLLIGMSLLVCRVWTRAYHYHLYELLDEYYTKAEQFWHSSSLSYLPFSRVNSEMEFRIFHSIFCEQFNIQRKAFAFDEYVYRKYEKYLLMILEIGWKNWLFVIILVCANWLRVEMAWDSHDCVRDDRRKLLGLEGLGLGLGIPSSLEAEAEAELVGLSVGHRILGASGDDNDENDKKSDYSLACEGESSIYNFIYCGIFLCGVCFCLAVVARYYELKLMACRGIRSSDDYALYLQTYEEAHKEDAEEEALKLSEHDLRVAVAEAKEWTEDHITRKHNNWEDYLLHDMWSDLKDSWHSCCNSHAVEPDIGEIIELDDKMPLPRKADVTTAEQGADRAWQKLKKVVKNRVLINENRECIVHKVEVDASGHLKGKDNFRHLFLFHNPGLFFHTINLVLMPIALYLALWLCNFLSVSAYVARYKDNGKEVSYQFETLLPGFFSVICYMYAVRSAALLMAVVEIDNDAMLEIIEQTEGARVLGIQMRDKIMKKLKNMGDPEAELKALFDEIDDNNSNLLSRKEFQVFLEAMGITFSRKKWSQIFVQIDLNNDDEISFKELFLFLFPDNDQAKLEETRRLTRVGLRVRQKAAKLAMKSAAHGDNKDAAGNRHIAEGLDKSLSDLGAEEVQHELKRMRMISRAKDHLEHDMDLEDV